MDVAEGTFSERAASIPQAQWSQKLQVGFLAFQVSSKMGAGVCFSNKNTETLTRLYTRSARSASDVSSWDTDETQRLSFITCSKVVELK
jgi:hypothetical protein